MTAWERVACPSIDARNPKHILQTPVQQIGGSQRISAPKGEISVVRYQSPGSQEAVESLVRQEACIAIVCSRNAAKSA